ncbi:MAG: tRNA-dihydrouridine synthase [Candidatus Moranbacteria bacterium GW2011_GWA2_39_41]|nr:MAG: tRNA-dihydrouridine synthase [Candidatus Moranbacteria bacterium GW2011_GWA2_39_41]
MNDNFWLQLKKPILALAPMAGITDSAFREICIKYGADVAYSEMASVSALFFKPVRTLELIKFGAPERPYVVQLFGKDPAHFAKATQIVTKEVKPDGIDINFGCPAKKVFGHGSGCALMPQKELAREIISAVCNNTDLPVSIKIRAGIEGRDAKSCVSTTAIEFIENIKDLPFTTVMVHARTYEGGFSGPLNFDIVSEIKKIIPDKIVLANGGINTPEDAKNILDHYPNIDGVGIARGAWGKPYIFAQIKNLMSNNCRDEACLVSTGNEYDFAKIKKIAIEHAELLWVNKGATGMFEIRKHLTWYFKGFPNASELRQKLMQSQSVEEIKDILK